MLAQKLNHLIVPLEQQTIPNINHNLFFVMWEIPVNRCKYN